MTAYFKSKIILFTLASMYKVSMHFFVDPLYQSGTGGHKHRIKAQPVQGVYQ